MSNVASQLHAAVRVVVSHQQSCCSYSVAKSSRKIWEVDGGKIDANVSTRTKRSPTASDARFAWASNQRWQ
jgi:hypothetical protein